MDDMLNTNRSKHCGEMRDELTLQDVYTFRTYLVMLRDLAKSRGLHVILREPTRDHQIGTKSLWILEASCTFRLHGAACNCILTSVVPVPGWTAQAQSAVMTAY